MDEQDGLVIDGKHWSMDVIRAALKRQSEMRKCAADMNADPPQDCDAPYCGCDPAWQDCIQMLQECGWKSPDDLRAEEKARG